MTKIFQTLDCICKNGILYIGVASGPARRPTKYPAGPENVSAGPVKTDRSPWQALVGTTGYAPNSIMLKTVRQHSIENGNFKKC